MADIGLIIAAGAGTRLADATAVPKPLKKVCGLPLLTRIIKSAAKGGLKKIFIVVGFQKEKIIDFINAQTWPVEIEFIENTNWKKSNGVSVLVAKERIRENFILLMSDHIFDFQTLANLRLQSTDAVDVLLAVDYKTHQIFDMDDATKVEVVGGKIKSIAKNLVQYNAIDTGMFLLSPKVFDALSAVLKNGDCSLSDGIRDLAQAGRAGVFDIGQAYWQDVDTPESLVHAEKMLLNSCRKDTDGFVSRHFNRYLSTFISGYLVKTPLTANQFTIFVLVLGLLSGYLAACGTYTSFLVAGILFNLTSILDGVDGEIAKLKYSASKLGQWLDTICDNVTYVVFTIGTVVGLYRTHHPMINILGPLAVFGVVGLLAVMYFYILKFSDSGSLLAVQKDFTDDQNAGILMRFFAKLHVVIKRDFFATLFLVLAVLGKPHIIVTLLTLATNIALLVILGKILRKK